MIKKFIWKMKKNKSNNNIQSDKICESKPNRIREPRAEKIEKNAFTLR